MGYTFVHILSFHLSYKFWILCRWVSSTLHSKMWINKALLKLKIQGWLLNLTLCMPCFLLSAEIEITVSMYANTHCLFLSCRCVFTFTQGWSLLHQHSMLCFIFTEKYEIGDSSSVMLTELVISCGYFCSTSQYPYKIKQCYCSTWTVL